MTIWKQPHISKVYEALSAIADERIELCGENEAKCTSTSRGKFYTINYDPKSNSIMSNDNSAFYTDNLSYPMIAILMLKGIVDYDKELLSPLKDIAWKDINQKYKDDFDLGLDYYFTNLFPKDLDLNIFKNKVKSIFDFVCTLKINHLGKKIQPPKAY